MNIKSMLIYSSIICILLTGCTGDKTKGEENRIDTVNKENEKIIEDNEKLATKEFLVELFNLTEEEIASYNIEEYISYLDLTESYFLEEKEYIDDFSIIMKELKTIKENYIDEKEYNFYYLVNAEEYEGVFPDIDTIKYLAVSNQVGTGGRSSVMDFEKNLIYDSYEGAEVYRNIEFAEKKIELEKDKKTEIVQALKDAKIWDWEYLYSDNSEHGMENWWHLGIEFENGIVVSYNGAGVTPDNYKPLGEILFKR